MTDPTRSSTPAAPTDAELLQAHVDGDPDAFGMLFHRHRDRLWAVALRTMGNPDDAADGLQDGMIAAFRRAGSIRGDAAVTTWLRLKKIASSMVPMYRLTTPGRACRVTAAVSASIEAIVPSARAMSP